MKRLATVTVNLELSADSEAGIVDAADEALAAIKCDLAMDRGDGEYFAARIVSKQFLQADEHRLLEAVLMSCRVTLNEFYEGRNRDCSAARHLFAFYAKRYLQWSWSQIADFVGRDKSSAIKGAQAILDLVAGCKSRRKGKSDNATRPLWADKAKKAMLQIQMAWSEK